MSERPVKGMLVGINALNEPSYFPDAEGVHNRRVRIEPLLRGDMQPTNGWLLTLQRKGYQSPRWVELGSWTYALAIQFQGDLFDAMGKAAQMIEDDRVEL